MKEWIAGLLAVLGTLLVLAGATVTVVKTLTPDPAGTPVGTDPLGGTATTSGNRFSRWLHRINAADRLIAWGVILLALAAVAAGAIQFTLGASAGTR
ncbi:hypothetical protein [Catellatospora citrea]|uniref:Uncharacterized protein n=1 Tax=Catellatospora citrea TaxID=53366 RepID=A0A8J3KLQ8_9ACTN|nr:hypothetical protein [Catellatospora citrea]RKE07870.1 hypothetical protein C8E86_2709 [Catellatospora citrea]GIG02122.1 hypothetical protein Cci01nite_72150 [Catellatospora citrea]